MPKKFTILSTLTAISISTLSALVPMAAHATDYFSTAELADMHAIYAEKVLSTCGEYSADSTFEGCRGNIEAQLRYEYGGLFRSMLVLDSQDQMMVSAINPTAGTARFYADATNAYKSAPFTFENLVVFWADGSKTDPSPYWDNDAAWAFVDTIMAGNPTPDGYHILYQGKRGESNWMTANAENRVVFDDDGDFVRDNDAHYFYVMGYDTEGNKHMQKSSFNGCVDVDFSNGGECRLQYAWSSPYAAYEYAPAEASPEDADLIELKKAINAAKEAKSTAEAAEEAAREAENTARAAEQAAREAEQAALDAKTASEEAEKIARAAEANARAAEADAREAESNAKQAEANAREAEENANLARANAEAAIARAEQAEAAAKQAAARAEELARSAATAQAAAEELAKSAAAAENAAKEAQNVAKTATETAEKATEIAKTATETAQNATKTAEEATRSAAEAQAAVTRLSEEYQAAIARVEALLANLSTKNTQDATSVTKIVERIYSTPVSSNASTVSTSVSANSNSDATSVAATSTPETTDQAITEETAKSDDYVEVPLASTPSDSKREGNDFPWWIVVFVFSGIALTLWWLIPNRKKSE